MRSMNAPKRKKILIVDDQWFNIKAILIILKVIVEINIELVCEKAMSGKEALKKVEENILQNEGKSCQYHLIFMDCSMPIMDGFETSKKIRELIHSFGLRQPIITALTG